MHRLKILHIPGWYPSEKSSVAGIFVEEHIKATSLFNDVVVLYSEGVDRSVRSFYKSNESIEDGIRTIRLRYRKSPIPKTTYIIYLLAMFFAFRKIVREGFKPDVIHAHIYSAGVPAVILGKLFRIPVIISEHFSGFPRGLIRGFAKFKAKYAFQGARFVCPVSKDLQDHIKEYGIKANFHVVPNVVDTSLFFPVKNNIKDERKDNIKRMLVVALLEQIKGIPNLLEAVSSLKNKRQDFFLDIVGDGSKRNEYEMLARDLDLSDFVFFHGLKSKKEVARFMRQSDFFILPSTFETFGVVLIEAMACGKPVLSTATGGPSEIINGDVGKLSLPGDQKALIEEINYMLDHYQDYDPKKIVMYAKAQYSYEAVGKEFNLIYRSTINKNIRNRL